MEILFALLLNIMGFIPAIIFTLVVFFINPILGVMVGLLFVAISVISVIYALRKDLIMKFLGWVFGAKK